MVKNTRAHILNRAGLAVRLTPPRRMLQQNETYGHQLRQSEDGPEDSDQAGHRESDATVFSWAGLGNDATQE